MGGWGPKPVPQDPQTSICPSARSMQHVPAGRTCRSERTDSSDGVKFGNAEVRVICTAPLKNISVTRRFHGDPLVDFEALASLR